MAQKSDAILGLGNPLLDIIATCTEDFLNKYGLKPNDAILATPKQDNLCSDMVQNFNVKYLAGGAVQNSMRVAQWFFNREFVCNFFGCIGDDDFGRQMKAKAAEDKVNAVYMIDPKTSTGTCACLITNNNKCRSLCAYLGASQNFHIGHVHKNIELVNSAIIYYVSGFHLIVNLDASLFLAQQAHSSSEKIFVLNLSAPYISQVYSEKLLKIFPYVDLLFGNETEARAFSEMRKYETSDLEIIGQKIADDEHRRPRTVVLTQGKENIVVAYSNKSKPLESYPVPQLKDEEIVDTTGAGDAFVGGFLAYKLAKKSMPECIKAATYAAQEIIKQSGCVFPKENKMKLE